MQDFRRTKRILRSTELDLSGWNLERFDAEKMRGSMVNCYLFDLPTRWIWMCSVPSDEFVSVSEQSHGTQALINEVRSGLAGLIGRRADGKPTPPVNGQDWEDQLALFLCAYAGTTQIWGAYRSFPERREFCGDQLPQAQGRIEQPAPFCDSRKRQSRLTRAGRGVHQHCRTRHRTGSTDAP